MRIRGLLPVLLLVLRRVHASFLSVVVFLYLFKVLCSGRGGTTVAVWIPSFAGPVLPPVVRASCNERGWRRQEGFEAGSRCDGPGVEAAEVCCSPEPLIVVVVETSSRLAISVGVSAHLSAETGGSRDPPPPTRPGIIFCYCTLHMNVRPVLFCGTRWMCNMNTIILRLHPTPGSPDNVCLVANA